MNGPDWSERELASAAMPTGRRALQWFALRIRKELKRLSQERLARVSSPHVDRMTAAFLQDFPKYLGFRASETYRHKSKSLGEWVLKHDAIDNAFTAAWQAADDDIQADARTADARAVGSLDGWLQALAEGRLTARGAPSGTYGMTDETFTRFHRERARRARLRPRTCTACHAHFVPARNAKRCPACRASARRHRTADA